MAETSAAKIPRLQVDDPLGRRVVVIDKPIFRIGRKSESDLRSVGTDVSREHAEIVRLEDGRFVLKDRGSRCGTFVNDEQVTERRCAIVTGFALAGAAGRADLSRRRPRDGTHISTRRASSTFAR